MPQLPTLRQTFKKEILNPTSIIIISLVALTYFSFSVLIINYRFLGMALFGKASIFYKLNLLFIFLVGSYYALGVFDFILMVITSILVGANLLMLFKILKSLRTSEGKVSFTVGGSTVIGILVAGSCSCGFSLISILGLTSALTFIPFGGLGIHLFSIFLLLVSLFYSLNTFHQEIVCKIK